MDEERKALSGAERMARFRKGKSCVRTWVDEESAEEYRELALEQGYPSVAAKLREHINTEIEQWKIKYVIPPAKLPKCAPDAVESPPKG